MEAARCKCGLARGKGRETCPGAGIRTRALKPPPGILLRSQTSTAAHTSVTQSGETLKASPETPTPENWRMLGHRWCSQLLNKTLQFNQDSEGFIFLIYKGSVTSEGVKTLAHILTESFPIQGRKNKASQVRTRNNRCVFPRLCPGERK